MINSKLGHIHSSLYILGHTECPIYLLDGQDPIVFDGGLSCLGQIYVEAIRSILGDRQPTVLLLSHVHWDHCGSVSFLKKAFPNMKVAASKAGADILKRPNALTLIKALNENLTSSMKAIPGIDQSLLIDEPFHSFEVDTELKDHGTLNTSGTPTIATMATPGHTSDHFSFWLPESKILIAGEAAGVYYGPGIVSTEFAYDYDAYLASLQRLAALPAEVFCQGHYGYLLGREEIHHFFDLSLESTLSFRARVRELLTEEAGSIDRVIRRIKAERYDPIPGSKQPEPAYLLNLQAQIRHLAKTHSAGGHNG